MDRHELLEKVIAQVELAKPRIGVVAEGTQLFGDESALDSMTFITLLVSLEESLDGVVDLSYLFLEQGDQDLRVNPFRDVGSLTDLILQSAGFGEQEQSSD